MECYIKIKLQNDQKFSEIMVLKELNDKEMPVMQKILDKISSSNSKSICGVLKDEVLNFMVSNGWQIIDGYYTISYNQLKDIYLKNRDGVSGEDIKNSFPHVPTSEVGTVNFKLMWDDVIMPGGRDKKRGYILKKYYSSNHNPTLVENTQENKSQFTKQQQKEFRSSIISKASSKDTCNIGFKDEFVNNLSDDEQKYIKTLSDLQIKIMRSEVQKRI